MRETDSYYVDKTPLIRELIDGGDHYFLSRPRRFGKSLLLNTLRELFVGSEPLFRGLHIHSHWDWTRPHPVVRLSFAGNYDEPGALGQDLLAQLAIIERNAGLSPGPEGLGAPGRLRDLLDRLHRKAGRPAVVLVDEYDKPILDVLGDTDMAKANRDHLRGFYGVIKDSAEHVRFTFVTGISMFSKVSLFSGLNNLRNISLDPCFATICGYTDGDLDDVFAPPSCPASTGTRYATGTTATTGGATRGFTTPLTSCCCSRPGNSAPTGMKPARLLSYTRP